MLNSWNERSRWELSEYVLYHMSRSKIYTSHMMTKIGSKSMIFGHFSSKMVKNKAKISFFEHQRWRGKFWIGYMVYYIFWKLSSRSFISAVEHKNVPYPESQRTLSDGVLNEDSENLNRDLSENIYIYHREERWLNPAKKFPKIIDFHKNGWKFERSCLKPFWTT